MNKVILCGRLTANPEVRVTANNEHSIATFSLAVDRKSAKQDQQADFIRIMCWDKKAEFAEKYLGKGSKVLLCGRIQTGSYKDKDGKTVYTTDVIAEEIEFADSKKNTEGPADNNSFMNVPDDIDGLPFN